MYRTVVLSGSMFFLIFDFILVHLCPSLQVKRVIPGEAAGDLVLEEDVKAGGGGIAIGQEGIGAGLDGLEGKKTKGAAGGPNVRLSIFEFFL